MIFMPVAEMRLRIDSLQTHQPHQPFDPFPIDLVPIPIQDGPHAPGAVKRGPGILFVDQTHES